MSAEHVAPSLEELFFAGAEDIGHFEPMLAHRSGGVAPAAGIRSSEPSVSSGLLVERGAVGEVKIAGRGFEMRVTQQGLNHQ